MLDLEKIQKRYGVAEVGKLQRDFDRLVTEPKKVDPFLPSARPPVPQKELFDQKELSNKDRTSSAA